VLEFRSAPILLWMWFGLELFACLLGCLVLGFFYNWGLVILGKQKVYQCCIFPYKNGYPFVALLVASFGAASAAPSQTWEGGQKQCCWSSDRSAELQPSDSVTLIMSSCSPWCMHFQRQGASTTNSLGEKTHHHHQLSLWENNHCADARAIF